MELNDKQIDLIDDFLRGRLKDDALAAFLKDVEENPSLKEELQIRTAIQEGIEHKSNLELKARLKQISAENKKGKKETKVFSLKYIRIVASIAAVALLCFFAYNLMDGDSDTQSIYATYFEPSELTITRSTDIEAELAELKEVYNTKKYDKALPLFKSVIDKTPTSNLKLAYGSTLLKCNKLDEARTQFMSIINANDPLYSDQSRWYMGLLELKSGNVAECKAFLDVLVSDTDSDYYTEASSLLKKLEEITE